MTSHAISSSAKTPPPRARERTIARFLKRQGGAAAIEFALVAAPVVALALAILQVSLIYFAQQALETAVEDTARLVLTNQAPTLGTTTQTATAAQNKFAAALCANSPGLFNCANLMVDLQPATSFASANVAAPVLTYDANGNVTNQWQYNPGVPGDIMVMRVMYQWPVFLGPLGFSLSNLPNNMHLLMSTAVFRNEP
jgi:Flp pilus assembly protein TadG